MLTPRLTICRTCAEVPSLLTTINCKISEVTKNLYQNVTLMVNKPFDGCLVEDLLHYKRILTYKNCNPDYAVDYTVESIASKVRSKTFGVSANCSSPVSLFTTTTTTTTIAPTTTTTTTLTPVDPIVTTEAVENISIGETYINFLCNGTFVSYGVPNIVHKRGFEFSQDITFSNDVFRGVEGSLTLGAYSMVINVPAADTGNWYVRSFVEDAVTLYRYYGDIVTFETAEPVVTTQDIGAVTYYSTTFGVEINGTFVTLGIPDNAEFKGFDLTQDITFTPGNITSISSSNTSLGTYSQTFFRTLTDIGTWYVRAYIKDVTTAHKYYGNTVTFEIEEAPITTTTTTTV